MSQSRIREGCSPSRNDMEFGIAGLGFGRAGLHPALWDCALSGLLGLEQGPEGPFSLSSTLLSFKLTDSCTLKYLTVNGL